MKKLIEKIKYNRSVKLVEYILDKGHLSGDNFFYYSYKDINYCLFYFLDDELTVKYNFFLECGMNDTLSEKELKNIIQDRFGSELNQKISNTECYIKLPKILKVRIQ